MTFCKIFAAQALAVTAILALLKILGELPWTSWWVVTAAIWLPVCAAAVLLVIAIFVVAFITYLLPSDNGDEM